MTRKTWSKIALVVILLTFLELGCQAGNYTNPESVLPEGTQVDDLALGGLTVQESQAQLKEWAHDKLVQKRALVYNETEVTITLKQLGIELDLDQTWDKMSQHPGETVTSVLGVVKGKAGLTDSLQQKFKREKKPAKNASYKIANNQVVITPEQTGQEAGIKELIQQIEELPLAEIPNRINIPAAEVAPALRTEEAQLLAFDGVIGEYKTNFSPQDENRTTNLRVAAKKLDQKVIKPGEIFSFNETVGRRTAKAGYKDAYVIIDNNYVKDTGGGICQVSSTLYNAILLANLQVVERYPHQVAVSYVPPGFDATVSFPAKDFKFKNNSSSLVYIRTQLKGGNLIVQVYGKKTNDLVRLEMQVESEEPYLTERKLDYRLRAGKVIQKQAGSNGYVVQTWRVIQDENGNETRQVLSKDRYEPVTRILRVGAKQRS